MAQAAGRDVLPDVRLPKKRKARKKETAPRKQREALFRNKMIKHLRSKGCTVKRLENAITGRNHRGIPDLIVFCPRTQWGGFIELKVQGGRLLEEQIDFMELCNVCEVKHIVAYDFEDVKEVWWDESYGPI
jgi:hypothetical protein